MNHTRVGVLSACLLVVGCGVDPLQQICDENLIAGDLVITELMVNPDGSDDDGVEYVELFNASAGSIDLHGLRLIASSSDGSNALSRLLGRASVAPGEYVVLANAEPNSLPSYADLSYGSALGSLRNSNGRVAVSCVDSLIDEFIYASSSDGRSIQLSGAIPPDSVQNDNPDNLCNALDGDELTPGTFGTPGEANSVCPNVVQGTCLEADGQTVRDVVIPGAGEAEITEWMANVSGPDEGFEWIEVQINADIDLNGLLMGTAADDLEAVAADINCLTVSAGSRVVFGQSAMAAPNVVGEFGFNLANSDERSIFLATTEMVIDQVDYVGSEEDVSWQIDSEGMLCLTSEIPANDYDPSAEIERFGTPGAENEICPPVVPEGSCLQADGETVRAIVVPNASDVRISEFMPNPAGADGESVEWIEVAISANVDLNGIQVGTETGPLQSIFAGVDCLPVTAGGFVVFGNGMGSVPVLDGTFTRTLSNSGDRAVVLAFNGTELDRVPYTSSGDAQSWQVDPAGDICLTAADPGNDYDPDAEVANYGTPGAANVDADCPINVPDGMCLESDGMTVRAINPATAGQVQITEWMANPTGSDTNLEWVEVRFNAAVDVNGLQLGTASDSLEDVIQGTDCVVATADSYFVFGDAVGAAPDVVGLFTFGLTNTGVREIYAGVNDVVLDSVSYNGSTEGRSRQKDAGGTICDTPVGTEYSPNNFGTPGDPSEMCL